MDSNSNPRIALFASGVGSNALALLHHDREVLKSNSIKLLICDRPDAPVIEGASKYNLQVAIVPRESLESRESHERKILSLLKSKGIEWIMLAGYLRILTENFIAQFMNANHSRIINIHPSLLPAYPGLGAYERAFNDGVAQSGVTVHFVSPVVDGGEIILQESFQRKENDLLSDFITRGKSLEHMLYLKVLEMLLHNRLIPQEKI